MKVVSDSSPLIALARIDCLIGLHRLYGSILIPAEVHSEVVLSGEGMPGASEVERAPWIEVHAPLDAEDLAKSMRQTGLGAGEVSAVLVAHETAADLLLIDKRRTRRHANIQGLEVIGCIGILETMHRRGHLDDLHEAYARLIEAGFRIEKRALSESLARLNLSPL